uniref:Odorant receptor n=1 Tax=Operophtera brumata TaxID=104452 RepID=A0A140YWR3_OPEBR|nr:pheromone receptor OR1 [Operophtera brumata]
MGSLDNKDKNSNEAVTTPMDYRYMKFLRLVLRIISGWPGKELGEKQLLMEGRGYIMYNATLSLLYFLLEMLYLRDHVEHLTFMELGHNYIVLLMTLLSCSRCVTLCFASKYPKVVIKFVEVFHLCHHRNKSEYAESIFQRVQKMSGVFTVYLSCITLNTLIMFNLTPVYNNYAHGKYASMNNLENTTYEHAIYLKFPFDAYSNFNGYMVAFTFNWYGSYLCASSVTMLDLFLSVMVFNIWGHFKILLNILETFPRPALENAETDVGSVQFSESEQADVKALLRECVIYHRFIADFANQMSDAFGIALFLYYMFHQVAGCLLLLECSQMNAEALLRYLPLTLMMFQQLIQVSIIFETIGSESDKLKHAVYEIPWECMNSKNRMTALIYLMNVQKTIHVTAGGMVDVGVTTMASILKTSFSYFAFLRTVGAE